MAASFVPPYWTMGRPSMLADECLLSPTRWRLAALAADGSTRELRGTAVVLVRDGLATLIEAGTGG